MKNIFIVFYFIFNFTSIFSQKLSDTINFDLLNKNLINQTIIDKVIEERKFKGATEIIKDTVPTASAKYHTLYFELYNDTITNHIYSIDYDLYNTNYIINTNFSTPKNRLFSLGIHINHKLKYELISETTNLYKINIDERITYNDFIDRIYLDFLNKNYSIVNDNSSEKKYLGLWNTIKNNHSNEITFVITMVISEIN